MYLKKENKMKKITGSLAVLASLGMISCSAGNIASVNNQQVIKPGTVTAANTVFVGDVGKGVKGANISVTFNFAPEKFETKATADGSAPKKPSDVTHAVLYLTTSSSDPLLETALKFTSTVLSYTGTTKTYSFANVPPGGPYFVAVELFDNVAAQPANNLIQPIAYGGTTATRGITVSSGAVPSVTVDADAHVSHNNALTISPALKSGTGASIDAAVTPTAGTFGGVITAS
jgi:hypothetical protein